MSGPIADRQFYCGQSTVPGMESPRSYAYDAIKLLADAMMRAKSADPRVYLSALASTKNFKGATGYISLDDSGNRIDAPVTVFTVEKGRLTSVGSSTGAAATDGGCPDCSGSEVCCIENSKKVCKAKCS